MSLRFLLTIPMTLVLLIPTMASADITTIWGKAKGTALSGTGYVYENLENNLGFGAEAGLEVLGIDLWGELVNLGENELLASGNLGWDLDVSLAGLRATIGADAGILLLEADGYGEAEAFTFSSTVTAAVEALNDSDDDIDVDLSELEAYVTPYTIPPNSGYMAATFRAQASIEYKVAKMTWVGLGGRIGYAHFWE